MNLIKTVLLAVLMAPLLAAPVLASNSNARAPQSLGIGERPPSPAATHDRESKEQEPRAPAARPENDTNGFTGLMTAAVNNDIKEIASLLEEGAAISRSTDLAPWMADPNTTIALRDCWTHLNRDNDLSSNERGYSDLTEIANVVDMPEALETITTQRLLIPKSLYHHVYGNEEMLLTDKFSAIKDLTALDLAAIAGNDEVIDLLLQRLLSTRSTAHGTIDDRHVIGNALMKLFLYADLAEIDQAKPLFSLMGISEPKKARYVSIAKKLWCAYASYAPYDAQEKMLWMLKYGPPYLTAAVAEEAATQEPSDFFNQVSDLAVYHHINCFYSGEKLGTLFALTPRPGSILVSLRERLLAQAIYNALFLKRLQKYTHDHQVLDIAMPSLEVTYQIPNDIRSIIRAYITFDDRSVRGDWANRIMDAKPKKIVCHESMDYLEDRAILYSDNKKAGLIQRLMGRRKELEEKKQHAND